MGQLSVCHRQAADARQGEGGSAANLVDGQGVECLKGARSAPLWKRCVDLEVTVQSPAHQHCLLSHVPHQSQTVVLSAFELDESDAELSTEHVDLSRFAELLLSHLFLAEICCPIEILLLLEDFECAVDAQLQTVVHAAAVHLFFCFEEGEGGSCEDVYHSLLEEGVLEGLEYLKCLTFARHSQAQLALVAETEDEDLPL